jgi:carboxyl-terminal processing protease
MTSLKKVLIITIAFLAIASSFFAGLYTGILNTVRKEPAVVSLPSNIEDGKPKTVDFGIFWDVWNLINEKYVSLNSATDQEKVWGAIDGLVGSLDDPYTVFFPPKEAEYFKSEIQGSFSGVGIEIGMNDKTLTVIAPLKGTPADKAGVLAGDMIVEIDGTPTSGLTIDESVDLIRGETGTPVVLTILREKEKEPLKIEIKRDTINIPTINTEKREDGVFVITLYSFSANSPYLFRDAMREFVESGYDKLILDLRNNPGGFLEASIDMASWFLPAGKPIVRETSRDGKGSEKIYRSKGYNIFNKNLKFAIIINQGSASASEILAGALSEYGKATLVGEKSFGKGSVQELVPIGDKASLKITIARWLTPNGISISKNGLTPDVEVEFTKEDFEAGVDPQLDKAVELLKAE